MVRNSFLTWEWWGWYQYWLDWKGERWILRHLMSWHPNPPEWLFSEDDEEVERLLDRAAEAAIVG
jgi:hypothetical protein